MGEGVDHRQVQRELGDVSVYLQKPVILSPTSARLSWTVSARLTCGSSNIVSSVTPKTLKWIHFCFFQAAHLSRYIQGYRVFYRTIGSSWLVQDVDASSDHSITLTDLQSATEYEVKIRPYFNELQGHDSLMVLLQTPDEGEKPISKPAVVVRRLVSHLA